MSKSILLARPHPFIVAEMKPWLVNAGYTVHKTDSLSELDKLARECDCAVISLAVVSSVKTTPEEVLKQVRLANPNLPIVFAALLPFAKAQAVIRDVLRLAHLEGAPRGVGESLSGSLNSSYLYISKDDLVNPELAGKASEAIHRFFQ